MHEESPRLDGPRVVARMAERSDIAAVLDFHHRNREHLTPTMPTPAAGFYTEHFWQDRLGVHRAEYRDGKSARFFLFPQHNPLRIIGTVSLTEIVRGPLQAAYLGYALDEHEQGRGLMSEALVLVIGFAFESLNLHRLMAGYLPTNERSGRVLRRLGFVVDGYARDYLYLGGAWRDHILTSLVNPDWVAPQ